MNLFNPQSFLQQVERAQQAQQEAILRVPENTPPISINQEGGFEILEIDLSATIREYPQRGHGVYFLPDSPPSARLNLISGGRWTSIAPGQFFEGFFDGLKFERTSGSIDSGLARLLILKTPNARAGLLPGIRACGVQSFIETQNRNAVDNTPSGATDGYPLVGVRSIRVGVGAENGQTLSGGGTLRFWHLLTAGVGGPVSVSNNWTLNQDMILSLGADASGQQYVVFPEVAIDVPVGRIHVEARSVTSSGGTALNVVLQVAS